MPPAMGQSCIAPGIRLRLLPRESVCSLFTRNAGALMPLPRRADSMLPARVLVFAPNDYTTFIQPCQFTSSHIRRTVCAACIFTRATDNFAGGNPGTPEMHPLHTPLKLQLPQYNKCNKRDTGPIEGNHEIAY